MISRPCAVTVAMISRHGRNGRRRSMISLTRRIGCLAPGVDSNRNGAGLGLRGERHPAAHHTPAGGSSNTEEETQTVETQTEPDTAATVNDAGTVFPCACNGCRNTPARFDRINYGADLLAKEIHGHYFDADTRRFFGSRILRVRTLDRQTPGDGDGGAVIVESLKGDWDGTHRVYRATVWCRYGHLVDRGIDGAGLPRLQFGTAAPAHKWAKSPHPLLVVAGCDCHGCTLDRENGGAR